MFSETDLVPISSLEKYSVCPRQCALIFVEGIWVDNVHTIIGTILHERPDKSGFQTDDDGAKTLRALPLYSTKYGLVGKADVVEIHDNQPVPVEYKKGKKKQWDNDDIQLCAQALCLEEMFNTNIPKGYIFHATSKRRREVLFDKALRTKTDTTITAVRALLQSATIPKAVLKPCCEGCSLRSICMPELSDHKNIYEELWK